MEVNVTTSRAKQVFSASILASDFLLLTSSVP